MCWRLTSALLLLIVCLAFISPGGAQVRSRIAPYGFCSPTYESPTNCMLADQLVNRFYPSSLSNPKHPKDRPGCYGIYSVNKSGTPLTIFADYSSKQGEFLVIRRKANGEYWAAPVAPSAQVIGPRGDVFGQNADCSINLVPLTQQGRRAILLWFAGRANLGTAHAMAWVFQWNGTKAKSLGPVRSTPAGYIPGWGFPDPAYLYPDSLAMVSAYDHFNGKVPHFEETHPYYRQIYRLKEGHYQFAAYAAYFGLPIPHGTTISEFLNGPRYPPGGPFVLRHNSTGPFILRIGNGNIKGKSRVSSAEVWINGKEVLPPGEINSNTSILTLPLPHILRQHNNIRVVAHGPPGSQLTVVIEDHTPHLMHRNP